MPNRRVAFLVALVLCTCLLALWLQSAAETSEQHSPKAHDKPLRPLQPPPLQPTKQPDPPAVEEDETPKSASAEAMAALAEALGRYSVRCELPPDAPDIALAHPAHVSNGVLHLMVDSPSGTKLLRARPRATPYAMMDWTSDGCELHPTMDVIVPGHIQVPPGVPMPTEVMCGFDCVFPVASDGSFQLRITRGHEDRVYAESGDFSAWVRFDSYSPPMELKVSLEQNSSFREGAAQFAVHVEQAFEQAALEEDMVNPYDVAMETPELSAAARGLLAEWKAVEQAERDEELDSLERMDENIEDILNLMDEVPEAFIE